jgi:Tol biopolymer transport system component
MIQISTGKYDVSPSFSPDGRFLIIYGGSSSGNTILTVYNIDSGKKGGVLRA